MAQEMEAVIPDVPGLVPAAPQGASGLLGQLHALGPAKIAALGLIFLAFLAFLSFLVSRALEPRYSILYSGLEIGDSHAIIQRLDALNVPYRITDAGDAVLVPDSQALRLRMSLAEEGLPIGNVVGYEIFDSGDAFGTTDFLSNVNLKRALEGELARTISSLRTIRAARVHIVQPKRQLFEREREEPSASVFLTMRGGTVLGTREISSIRHLVAAAVPGLSPLRVTVLDDSGNLLARSNDEGAGAFALDEAESHRLAQEERLKRKIVQLLERSIGPGRVDAEVSVRMSFDEISTTEEMFDPESQVARSTQTVEEESDLNERDPENVVGVSGNLPAEQAGGADAATTDEQTARTEETVNYEISRTVRSQTRRGGKVERISIAVQVDGIYEPGADGEAVYTPRSVDELDELEMLVRSAAGIDDDRGDTVSVVSRQFAPQPIPEAEEESWLALEKADYLRFGELGLIGIISLLVILLGVKPALRLLVPDKPMVPSDQPTSVLVGQDGRPLLVHAATGSTISIDDEGRPVIVREGQPLEQEPLEEEDSTPEPGDERVRLSQVEGSVRLSLVNDVADVIENRPDDAIRVIRGWLQME